MRVQIDRDKIEWVKNDKGLFVGLVQDGGEIIPDVTADGTNTPYQKYYYYD